MAEQFLHDESGVSSFISEVKEYLQDYASPDTYAKGIKLIEEEIQHIPNPKIKEIALRNLKEIEEGKRDFRF